MEERRHLREHSGHTARRSRLPRGLAPRSLERCRQKFDVGESVEAVPCRSDIAASASCALNERREQLLVGAPCAVEVPTRPRRTCARGRSPLRSTKLPRPPQAPAHCDGRRSCRTARISPVDEATGLHASARQRKRQHAGVAATALHASIGSRLHTRGRARRRRSIRRARATSRAWARRRIVARGLETFERRQEEVSRPRKLALIGRDHPDFRRISTCWRLSLGLVQASSTRSCVRMGEHHPIAKRRSSSGDGAGMRSWRRPPASVARARVGEHDRRGRARRRSRACGQSPRRGCARPPRPAAAGGERKVSCPLLEVVDDLGRRRRCDHSGAWRVQRRFVAGSAASSGCVKRTVVAHRPRRCPRSTASASASSAFLETLARATVTRRPRERGGARGERCRGR